MSIYIQHAGKQLGPFTEAELKTQLASGAISLEDHVWWDGQANWVVLGQTAFAAGFIPAAPGSGPTVPGPGPFPGTPVARQASPETSKLAIWALVCGCLGFFLSLLASIPAIVLGHMGLSQIKKNPGMRGEGMALAGLILGYVFTLLLPFISIVAISVLIALGNQVQAVFSTISSQLAVEQAEQGSNSADLSATPPDQTTTAPEQGMPAQSASSSPDPSTKSTPAATDSPDSGTPSSAPGTNAPDNSTHSPATSTNAAPSQ